MKMLWQVLAMAFLPLFAFQDGKQVEKGEEKLDGKDRRGRKDGGQEVEPDEKELEKLLPKIKAALKSETDAKAECNKNLKNWGKKCGFLASVLRKAGKAALAEDESRETVTRYSEQMSLALEVVAKAAAK